MDTLPGAWVGAASALDELNTTFAEYAYLRLKWMKFRHDEQKYTDYLTAKANLIAAHRAWKSAMSRMIQGRQL